MNEKCHLSAATTEFCGLKKEKPRQRQGIFLCHLHGCISCLRIVHLYLYEQNDMVLFSVFNDKAKQITSR